MRKHIFIAAMLFISSVQLFSQTGKEFWFALPYIDPSHDNDADITNCADTNFFRISTGEIGTTVEFYYFPSGTKTLLYSTKVAANTVKNLTVGNAAGLDLKLSDLHLSTYNTILERGIFIWSSAPINIYYEIGSPNNTELFPLKSKDALGKAFYPVLQNVYNNKNDATGSCGGWGLNSYTSLDIVATENNTTVTIDLPTGYTSSAYNTLVTR